MWHKSHIASGAEASGYVTESLAAEPLPKPLISKLRLNNCNLLYFKGPFLAFLPMFMPESKSASLSLTDWHSGLTDRFLDFVWIGMPSNMPQMSQAVDHPHSLRAQSYWNFNCCTVRDKRKCSLLLMYWHSIIWRHPVPRTSTKI